MSKIPPPTDPNQIDTIAFYSTPSWAPSTTAFDMLVYLMEQPWADVKRGNGQVIVSDLRHTVGGTVCAVYTESNVAPPPAPRTDKPGVVLEFRPREAAPA